VSEPSAYDPIRYWSELLGERYDDTGVALSRAVWIVQSSLASSPHPRDPTSSGPLRAPRSFSVASPRRWAGSGIWIRFWTEFGARQIVGVDLTEVAVERLRMRHPQATFLQADVGESGLSRRGRVRFHLRDERSCCISLTTPAGAAHFATSLRSSLPAGHLVVIDPVVVHGWWGHSSVRRPI